MSTDFNLIIEKKDKALIIKTEGYINNAAGEKIVEEFTQNFTDDMSKLIMDLEKSKVVNSIGISYLIDIIEQLNEKNGKLIFTNLDSTIDKTFNLMGIFQFAEKAESIDLALNL